MEQVAIDSRSSVAAPLHLSLPFHARLALRRLFVWPCLLWVLGVSIAGSARGANDPSLEYRVKAAFLLNFTKFVEWPPFAFADEHSTLDICVFGDDPFGTTLNDMVRGEMVNGHELTVRTIRRPPAPKSCQVLFFSKSERDVARTIEGLNPGVLTDGENEKFLEDGGIIAFVIDKRKVRFDINQRAAVKAMLTMSSRLLNVARSVEK